MRHRSNEWAAPARQSASTPATETWQVTSRTLVVGLAGLALVAMLIAAIHHWSQGQVPNQAEVRQTVARLTPACRPIIQARFRMRLIREGRPLTRGEVEDMVEGITDCDAINQQMSGLQDG